MQVRLGCTVEERADPQGVELDVAVRFAEPPPGCATDELVDTVDYCDLIEAARSLCAEREFKLIEHLAAELQARLRRHLPASTELWLRITKLHPPVKDLEGGVSFSLGAWEPAGR